MKTIRYFLVIPLLVLASSFPVKELVINGKIISETGDPLPGVSIIIKGTKKATITDTEGKFNIVVNDTDSLVFSYIGYMTQILPIEKVNGKEITLDEEVTSLDEVVVVGYGTEKESFVTGAIVRIENALEGKVSGVMTEKSTSADYESMKTIDFEKAYEDDAISDDKTKGIGPAIAPGLLTAGEIPDFSKWNLWKDISENELNAHRIAWEIYPLKRYTLQVETENNMPVIDAEVNLADNKGKIIWKSHTDNTGKAECWLELFDTTNNEKHQYTLSVNYNGNLYEYKKADEFHNGVNILKIPVDCQVPGLVDVAFVVDATGSMGDEIEYLKVEMNDIIKKVKDSLIDTKIRLGSIFYRDHGDDYLVKMSDLSENIQNTIDFIKSNNACGGGDFPESVEIALDSAINSFNWDPNATARIVFLVLDAPPHNTPEIRKKLDGLIAKASEKGIRIVPVTCSGIDKSTEYLMRCIALATNGTYVFLTNHSGIGGKHIEPTTDKYDVEFLNGVLVRLICSFTHVQQCGVQPVIEKTDTLVVKNPLALKIPEDTPVKNDTMNTEIPDTSGKTLNTEPKQLISWKYYPNPTKGIINIEIEGNISELFVSDLTGKIIQRYEINGNSFAKINISDFPNGMYLIRYEYDIDKWMSGKVLLVH